MEFEMHGRYKITVEDDILHVDAYGPFNDVFSSHYHLAMKEIIKTVKHKPWATLVTYYGNSIFTPEAESQLIELTKYRSKHGMVANATIFRESVHTDLQHMQVSRIYEAANIPCHVFPEKRSAKNWLSEYLKQRNSN